MVMVQDFTAPSIKDLAEQIQRFIINKAGREVISLSHSSVLELPPSNANISKIYYTALIVYKQH